MKKFYITVVVIMLLTLLAACAGTGGEPKPVAESETPRAIYSAKGWGHKTVSPEEAKELIGQEDVVLVDVRTPEEFASGYIPGAVLLPLDDIGEKAAGILPDKDKVVIVYCRSGRRSAIAAQQLNDMGYLNVLDLGGIQSWPYDTVKAEG